MKSTKSPIIVVLSFIFVFPFSSGKSLTAPSSISIDTVPLQSTYSLFGLYSVLGCSKFDNTNWYFCPTICDAPFTVAV